MLLGHGSLEQTRPAVRPGPPSKRDPV